MGTTAVDLRDLKRGGVRCSERFNKPRPVSKVDPHPVIVTIRDNRDYIRVLLYSYYTTITGWGVLLTYKH